MSHYWQGIVNQMSPPRDISTHKLKDAKGVKGGNDGMAQHWIFRESFLTVWEPERARQSGSRFFRQIATDF
jgi:hypothetical protein